VIMAAQEKVSFFLSFICLKFLTLLWQFSQGSILAYEPAVHIPFVVVSHATLKLLVDARGDIQSIEFPVISDSGKYIFRFLDFFSLERNLFSKRRLAN
jgi:hypothetical protein